MASLAEMKAAAAAQGATAPPDYPGGPDAWVADWHQNAVNAGSLQGTRTKGEATATDATTGATSQGYKNTGTSSFADMIRQKAKAEGWSEDFERFSDAQIDAWQKHYDPATGKFRSENDPTGAATYDKPAECPPGTTFHGSKCVAWENLPPELGGGQAGGYQAAQPGGGAAPGAAAGAQPAYFGQDDPLQRMLTNQMASGGGTFAGSQTGGQFQGGGVFSQGAGQITPQGPASAATPAVNPAATAALAALPGTSAVGSSPAGTGTSVLGSAARPEMGVLGTGSISGLETGVMGTGSLSGLDTKPSTGVMGTGSISGTNASAKQPDAFGVQPGSGGFEDLIDPRQKRKDARLGGNWF